MLSNLIRQHCTLTSETVVLDFGCGTHGSISMNVCPDVARVVGVDSNKKAVREFNKKCNHQGLEPDEVCAIVTEQFWNDSSWQDMFNLVVASLVFHHLTDHFAVCAQLRTIAANNARLVIIDLVKKPGINGISHQELARHVAAAGWSNVVVNDGPKIKLASGKRTNLFVIVAANT